MSLHNILDFILERPDGNGNVNLLNLNINVKGDRKIRLHATQTQLQQELCFRAKTIALEKKDLIPKKSQYEDYSLLGVLNVNEML